MHYQKIILALTETDRLMKEIDKVDFNKDKTLKYRESALRFAPLGYPAL